MQINLYLELEDQNEALRLIHEIFKHQLKRTIEVVKIEPYWKIEGWFRVLIDVSGQLILNEEIELFLNLLASRWNWNGNNSEAYATHTLENTTFINPHIRFINIWFEMG